MEVFVSLDIRILHDIFRFPILSQYRPRNPVQPLIVSAHQDFEQSCVAFQNAFNQRFVRYILKPRNLCGRSHGDPPP
jgi:hypothetical protein